MKKRFLPLSMLLITMVLAQASFVANAAGIQGKYTPRTSSKATISSFMKSIRANQETGLIDPADLFAAQQAAQTTTKDGYNWGYTGPDNFGGLTRAVVYDKKGRVVIGTMAGDIYRTENDGITFKRIANIGYPISCMVMNSDGVIFIGTGDGRDAQNLNGLANIVETSFVGNGIFKMTGDKIEQIASTLPANNSGWLFVNEMTIAKGKIYAATAGGLMVSTNETGTEWELEPINGAFVSVKSNNHGDVLASAMFDGKKIYKVTTKDEVRDTTYSIVSNVYLKKAGGDFVQITGTEMLPFTPLTPNSDSTTWSSNDSIRDYNQKIIAMSPSDENFMYIAFLKGTIGDYSAGNIYYTNDGGESWAIAVGETTLYTLLNSDANHDGFMAVNPNNPRKLYIGSDDLIELFDETETGIYRPLQISEYFTDETSAYVAWNRSYYLHQGIQNIVFNPENANVFYIGTNGGIFKGLYAQGLYSYKGSNRYFISDKIHCSATRVMNVGIGGRSKVLAASLDHGTIKIVANPNADNLTTGVIAFPHVTSNDYVSSLFTKSYAGGPCAISTINPDMMFMSTTGNLSTPIYRTETDAEDFDHNFEGGGDSPVVTNANAFRTPVAFFENYNDMNNPIDTIYAPVRTVKHIGDTVLAYSVQASYPVYHQLTEDDETVFDSIHMDPEGAYIWVPGDTIRNIHDPISTLYLCCVENKIYMTRDALIFNKATEWLEVSAISGIPSAVAIGDEGDMALVGTEDGKLYKVTGLATTFTEDDLAGITCTIAHDFSTEEATRAITSVAVDPIHPDTIVVTLGNYGHDDYVYLSSNSGSSFKSIQGTTLPKAPVYSSLIEKTEGKIFVGTETGIYVREDGKWKKTGNVSCPVMEIKQAVLANRPNITDVLYDEAGDTTQIVFHGINNEGMIYAATYGAGVIYCDTYAVQTVNNDETNNDDDDNNVTVVETLDVYPNPVKGDAAHINISLDENATVSYVLYDLSGRMIENNNLGTYVKGTHTLNINTSGLKTGSYIIRVNAGEKTETTKFLVY